MQWMINLTIMKESIEKYMIGVIISECTVFQWGMLQSVAAPYTAM